MDLKEFKKWSRLASKKQNLVDKNKEKTKEGVLRGGSAGALVGGTAYYSQCGRLAQARLLSKQIPITESQRVMFSQGYAMEEVVKGILQESGLKFKQEKDYLIDNSEIGKIGMRPDFEIYSRTDDWLGIEVKSLASPFSVIKQKKNGFPFMKHMIQSAVYMTFLNREKWVIVIGQAFNTNQNGKKIDSGLEWYLMRSLTEFGKTTFYIENEKGEMEILPFTAQHIIDYYKEVRLASGEKRLMIRPTEKELRIDTYDRCKYCPMQSACNEYDVGQIDFETWLSRVETSKEKNQGD